MKVDWYLNELLQGLHGLALALVLQVHRPLLLLLEGPGLLLLLLHAWPPLLHPHQAGHGLLLRHAGLLRRAAVLLLHGDHAGGLPAPAHHHARRALDRVGQAGHAHLLQLSLLLHLQQSECYQEQCCGSGSGIRCLFDPWIRDPRFCTVWVKNQDPDPGSGPGTNNLDHISESFETISWVKLLIPYSLIRKKVGSWIRDNHPGSATLNMRVANPDQALIVAGISPDVEILRVPDPNSYVPFSTEARKFCIKKHDDTK
jgi:hypothetical protein